MNKEKNKEKTIIVVGTVIIFMLLGIIIAQENEFLGLSTPNINKEFEENIE